MVFIKLSILWIGLTEKPLTYEIASSLELRRCFFYKIGIAFASLSSTGKLFCSMQELIMLVRKRRCLLIHFLKRFSGISLFLVAFLMSRFKIPFSLYLEIGINLIFLGTKSFYGFPIDAILKILVWFWKQYVSFKWQRYGERFNLTFLVILVKFLFKILSDSGSSDTSLYFSIGISFEFNPPLLESSLLVFQNFLLLLINLHIVPLRIWYHLFLEFWLVDTWFFAPLQDQRAATYLKNVRQLNKGGAKS